VGADPPATPGSAARRRSGWWRALWREDAGDGCPPTPLASPQGRARLEVMRPGLTRCAIACQRRRRGHLARRRVVLRRGGPSVALRPRTFAQLQDHQRVGVRWLVGAVGRGGGILGDDPGLGKTLQVLTAIDALISAGKATQVLIVAQAGLLGNWEAEMARKTHRPLDWSRYGVRNGSTSHPVQVCAGFQAFPLLVWVCVVPRKRLVRSVKRLVSIDTAFRTKSAIFTFCCE
jgi:hypothetical protein